MAQMTLISAILQYLTSVTELTDLLSVDPNTNTPNIRPANTTQDTKLPYITILQIADNTDQDLSGATVFTTRTFSFNIVTNSMLEGAEIAEVLRKNLDGYQQRLMPPGVLASDGGIWVHSVRKTNGFNFSNSPQTGDQYIKQERTEIYDFGIPLDDNVVHPPVIV